MLGGVPIIVDIATQERRPGEGDEQPGRGDVGRAGDTHHGRQQDGRRSHVAHKGRHEAHGDHDEGYQPKLAATCQA